MSPATFESAFDSMTSYGLEQIGMDPEFVADYVNWEILRDTFDFTKVDRDVSQNLLNTAGMHASKKMFEEAGKILDRGLDVVAGVMGATGQIYGAGAAILGEEALDWAEGQFENWMGWNEDETPQKGHWVLIDEGTRRRRLPLATEDEEISQGAILAASLRGQRIPTMAPKSDLHREMTLALAVSGVEHGRITVIDEKMNMRHPRVSSTLRLTPEMEAKLNENPNTERMRDIAEHHTKGLHQPLADKINSRVGEKVKIDGDLFTVVRGTNYSHVVAERDGRRVTRPWEEVEPAWNTGHIATTYRTEACPATVEHRRLVLDGCIQRDFVTNDGFGVTSYAWYGNELVCVVEILGKDEVIVWSAHTGDEDKRYVQQLTKYAGGSSRILRKFREAVRDKDHYEAMVWLPSKQHYSYTSPDEVGSLADRNITQSRRGKSSAEPSRPFRDDDRYETPGLAQRKDRAREKYELDAALYANQQPPDKYGYEWETASMSTLGGSPPPYRPQKEGAGVDFIPIALGGLLVAFALTR